MYGGTAACLQEAERNRNISDLESDVEGAEGVREQSINTFIIYTI